MVKQDEVIKQVGDGFALAWDTNVVPKKVREEFEHVVANHLDALVEVLAESGAAPSRRGARRRGG